MAASTRERILGKARGLLEQGERPTVAQISQAAGVSRASFYRAFESRASLLDALSVQPEPAARERILEAALGMVGARGLNALSMDELAVRADVSRATLYRLFPGKALLFASLITKYSPLEPVSHVLLKMQNEPPEAVMPEIARTVYRAVYGSGAPGFGVVRALFFEVTALSPDAEEATRDALRLIVGSLGAYLVAQMVAERIRPMHPLLALQSFVGPVFFHLLTREVAERVLGLDIDGEQAVTELAENWLRGMKAGLKEDDANE